MSNKRRFDLDSSGCAVAFVLNLTERKRAEEALRESERTLRSVIDEYRVKLRSSLRMVTSKPSIAKSSSILAGHWKS